MSCDQLFVINASLTTRKTQPTWLPMPKPEPKIIVFNMRLTEDLIAALDDLRRQEEDIPTRSEMARRCIEIVAVQRKVMKG